MNKTCKEIQKLLPSYADSLCSEETRRDVEEHVRGCEECRELLDALQAREVELFDQPPAAREKASPKKRRRNRIIALVTAVVLVFAVIAVVFVYNPNLYYQYLYFGDRIHINLAVNGIDELVPIDECVEFRYTYIGDEDLDAPIKIREALRWYTNSFYDDFPTDDTNTYGYEWVPLSLERTGDNSFTTSLPGGKKGYYMIRVDVKPPLYDYIFPDLPNPDPNWNGVIYTYDIFNLDGWETWDYELIMQMEYYETNCSVQISDKFTCHSSSGVYTSNWQHNVR